MTIEFSTITAGLWNFAGWLAYVLPPIVMVGVSLRAVMYILNICASSIIRAFGPEPPPPLTREQFEAKYGPLEPEDLELTKEVLQRTRPTIRLMLWFFAVWTVGLMLLFIATASKGVLYLAAMYLIGLVVYAAGGVLIVSIDKRRYPGMRGRDWTMYIRRKYNVAPDERLTFRPFLTALTPKKS